MEREEKTDLPPEPPESCVDEKPFLGNMLAYLAVSFVFLLVGVGGVFLILLQNVPHPLALFYPYAFSKGILIEVLGGYIFSIPGWVLWIKYLSDMSRYVSGGSRSILDAFIVICLFAPVLMALFFWPLGLHPFSFNFMAFGGGLLFTCCYFTFAVMFLR